VLWTITKESWDWQTIHQLSEHTDNLLPLSTLLKRQDATGTVMPAALGMSIDTIVAVDVLI